MNSNPLEKLVDIGANLTNPVFKNRMPQVLLEARQAGVEKIVITGTNLAESKAAAELAANHPAQLYATAGVHPHDASSWDSHHQSALSELSQRPQVVAIGECGLDFNRNYSSPEEQRLAFTAQLELAVTTQLPVFLHERDAFADMHSVLSEYRPQLSDAVVHCFTGNTEQALAYLELDCHLGITGWACDERRGADLQAAVPHIPSERLMIETDAPYLLPRTLRPRPKSRHNQPAYLPEVARIVAELRNTTLTELSEQTWATSCRFFRLSQP